MIEKETDLAWLAGLLEGEGSFSASQHNKPPSPRTPRVSLAMCDLDIVQRAALLMYGKRVTTKPVRNTELGNPRKPQWQVTIYGQEAVNVMNAVLPFMGVRRSERIKSLVDEWYAERPHLERIT